MTSSKERKMMQEQLDAFLSLIRPAVKAREVLGDLDKARKLLKREHDSFCPNCRYEMDLDCMYKDIAPLASEIGCIWNCRRCKIEIEETI